MQELLTPPSPAADFSNFNPVAAAERILAGPAEFGFGFTPTPEATPRRLTSAAAIGNIAVTIVRAPGAAGAADIENVLNLDLGGFVHTEDGRLLTLGPKEESVLARTTLSEAGKKMQQLSAERTEKLDKATSTLQQSTFMERRQRELLAEAAESDESDEGEKQAA